ncbi:MAG: dihydroorotate dehydrogenase electron transfer subunit [Candidatus Limimorpha sp.]
MKKITDFTIVGKEKLSHGALFRLKGAEPLPPIAGGQFVQVRVDGNNNVYLRRPISIHDVDMGNNTIDLLIQEAHEGTKTLCSLPLGANINIILPLGNGFTMPQENDSVLLVGGGVGIAPLLYFAKTIKAKYPAKEVAFLLGGRTKDDLALIDRYKEVGEVSVTTNDGSLGENGFVTQHSLWDNMSIDKVYSCGPLPMMKAVAKMTDEKGIWCEVSLENSMACGIGACLCCVENTTDGNVCVCKEGPVFNTKRLLW